MSYQSVGCLDFLVALDFTSVDSSCDGGYSGHSVLALLNFGDCDVAGMDGELVGSSIGFVFCDFVNVDGPFLSVDLDDLALAALPGTPQDDDLIIFSDGEGSDAVFASERFGKGGRHDSVSDVGGGREMGLSLFSPAAAYFNVSLHNYGSIINIILIFYQFLTNRIPSHLPSLITRLSIYRCINGDHQKKG